MSESEAPAPLPGPPRLLLGDGYTDIPPGRIAAIATSLEMRSRPPLDSSEVPSPLQLRMIVSPSAVWYRNLFRRIGGPWLWQSRLRIDDNALLSIIRHPDVEVWAGTVGGEDVGLVELDFRFKGECELAFFGLTTPWTGVGAGRVLMRHAIARAWSRPISRFWVHTCTLDHPSALRFYVRSGFTPYKLQTEVSPDPRLDGTLPADARPDLPIIR